MWRWRRILSASAARLFRYLWAHSSEAPKGEEENKRFFFSGAPIWAPAKISNRTPVFVKLAGHGRKPCSGKKKVRTTEESIWSKETSPFVSLQEEWLPTFWSNLLVSSCLFLLLDFDFECRNGRDGIISTSESCSSIRNMLVIIFWKFYWSGLTDIALVDLLRNLIRRKRG